jgi:hypothetical protein
MYMIAKMAMVALMACDPALTSLFTPPHPRVGRYEVCTTSDPIDRVIGDGRSAGVEFGDVEALEALAAFGAAGQYDRSRLARLFRGARVRVARGWMARGDELESITLLSPYPDATLDHLQPGTLVIRLVIPRNSH